MDKGEQYPSVTFEGDATSAAINNRYTNLQLYDRDTCNAINRGEVLRDLSGSKVHKRRARIV